MSVSGKKVFLAWFMLDTGLPEVDMIFLVFATLGGPEAIVPAEVGSIGGKNKGILFLI